jgi:hypothetical protein
LNNNRAVELESSGAEEGFWMDDEAAPTGGLDAKGAPRRPRWGRRTPYGIRRDGPRRDDWHSPVHERQGATDAATYAALDLGTNNCRLLIARPAGEASSSIQKPSSAPELSSSTARLSFKPKSGKL